MHQFTRFLATGGIAAAVNLGARWVFDLVMPFEWAVFLAFPLGVLTAYTLARRFVFQASGRSVGSELQRFTIVNLAALVLVWGISVGLARIVFPAIGFTWHAHDIAHLIGVLAPAAMSFVAHRYYSFGRI
jgi:putative flippase GtrA